jgi:hypothetical protein
VRVRRRHETFILLPWRLPVKKRARRLPRRAIVGQGAAVRRQYEGEGSTKEGSTKEDSTKEDSTKEDSTKEGSTKAARKTIKIVAGMPGETE